MRVETVIPAMRVEYRPGVDEAEWVKIWCEFRDPESGKSIEHNYLVATKHADRVNDPSNPYWRVMRYPSGAEHERSSFPATLAKAIVFDTSLLLMEDYLVPGIMQVAELEPWIVIAPDNTRP